MSNTNTFMHKQEPIVVIENEVVFLDSIKQVEDLSATLPVKMEYNAIIHCRQGRVLLELGGNQQVHVQAGQLLLIPAQKLLLPMMVSTNVDSSVLLVSDRMLKSVLGSQIDIWNRAMYMHETYVLDAQQWSDILHRQGKDVFSGKDKLLYKEIAISFLRIFLLIICEVLLHMEKDLPTSDASTKREKMVFNQFLSLLSHETQKRRQVAYYAERLFISPKYLSKVCRNVSGKSPLRWITDSVMEDSYALLRNTGLTVKEISNRMGFPNSSFFCQYFREQAGITPIEYRNKITNQL